MPANSSYSGMNFTYSQYVNYTCDSVYEQTSGSTPLQGGSINREDGQVIRLSAPVRAAEDNNLEIVLSLVAANNIMVPASTSLLGQIL